MISIKHLTFPSDCPFSRWCCYLPTTQAPDLSETVTTPFSLPYCQSLARPRTWVCVFYHFLLVPLDLHLLVASHLPNHSSLLTIRSAVSSLSIATPRFPLPFHTMMHYGATLSCSLMYSLIHSFVHTPASFEHPLMFKLI